MSDATRGRPSLYKGRKYAEGVQRKTVQRDARDTRGCGHHIVPSIQHHSMTHTKKGNIRVPVFDASFHFLVQLRSKVPDHEVFHQSVYSFVRFFARFLVVYGSQGDEQSFRPRAVEESRRDFWGGFEGFDDQRSLFCRRRWRWVLRRHLFSGGGGGFSLVVLVWRGLV